MNLSVVEREDKYSRFEEYSHIDNVKQNSSRRSIELLEDEIKVL